MTMYRARVELVDGWRVRAGGKWLRCIGNRAVHVGELVWTDGRCVYGYDKDGVQPIVITKTNIEGIEGIPVLIFRNSYYNTPMHADASYYTVRTAENYQEISSETTTIPIGLITDHTNSAYIVNRPAKLNYENDTTILALNIDRQGNIYALKKQRIPQVFLGVYSSLKIYVTKNETILNEIDLTEKALQIYQSVYDEAHDHTEPYEIEPNYGSLELDIGFGVIENENNWAFMACIGASCSMAGYRYRFGGGPPVPPKSNSSWNDSNSTSVIHTKYFFFNPNGETEFFFRSLREHIGYSNTHTFHHDSIITLFKDAIPIQDGYSYKINSLDVATWKVTAGADGEVPFSYLDGNSPGNANITIYSPNGSEIVNCDIVLGAYLTIYKGRLLGIDDVDGYGLFDADLYNLGRGKKSNTDTNSGLYSITDKKLTKILNGRVRNYRLRALKMKKKNEDWLQKAKILDCV